MKKKKPSGIVVGDVNGAATMENTKVHQNIQNRTALCSSNSTSEWLPKGKKNLIQKDIDALKFTAALFQTKYPTKCEWIRETFICVYTYIHVHTHIYVYISIHIYTYTHIYAHTHPYIHTMEYYSGIAYFPLETIWMDLECIMLHESIILHL